MVEKVWASLDRTGSGRITVRDVAAVFDVS
jgi:hypothetical protein